MALSSRSYKYNSDISRPQNSIQTPNEIKCKRCSIVKNKTAFSSNALADLADHISKMKRNDTRFNAKITDFIACMSCTTQQRTELQCAACDKWMGLDRFTKTQRRRGDEAMCMRCVQEQVDTEPAGRDSSDDGNYDSDQSDAYYSGDEEDSSSVYWTHAGTSSGGGVRLPAAGDTVYTGSNVAMTASSSATNTVIGPSSTAGQSSASTSRR